MSATDDVARMLTLVPWLLERPGASLDEAAEAFGVTTQVIRRDLDHLDFCGLPGLGGGDLFEVNLVGDRVVLRMADELKRPLRLTPQEGLRLVLTADAVAEVAGDDLPALRSAVDKVRDALGIPERVADVVAEEAAGYVADARRACAEGRQVLLRYQGRADEGPRDRIVDPWTLHVVDGTWYLQGHDQDAGDRRTFRLDRAVGLEVLDTPIGVPAPEQLPPPRYEPGPDDVEVTVEVEASARWLADALTIETVEEREDGGARLTFRTDAPRWVARLVLMAGGGARVTGPPHVAATVRDLADQAAGAYRDD